MRIIQVPIYSFDEHPNKDSVLAEMRDINIMRAGFTDDAEFERLTSDEAVIDTIRTHGYEFYPDGTLIEMEYAQKII